MIKNDKVQIRISEELLDYCKDNSENLSRFIRDAMRAKIEFKSTKDNTISLVEIRARTPFTFFAELDRDNAGDTLILNLDLGFVRPVWGININSGITVVSPASTNLLGGLKIKKENSMFVKHIGFETSVKV